MGIFGSIGKHLTRPGFGDRLLAAGSIVNGDYGTAGQIRAVGEKRRADQQQSQAEAQQRAQLEAAAVQMGVPPQQAASLPTSALAGLVSQQYQPRAPSEFERTLQSANIDPNSPEGQALYRQRANTMALPAPQMVGSPERGYQWVQPPAPGMPTQGLAQQTGGTPPPEAVQALRLNPQLREDFDRKYGPGSAARVLGGGASNGTGTFPRGVNRFRFP